MKNPASNVLGWLGLILILAAYILLSFSILDPTDIAYQLLNAVGALGIVIETYNKKDYQPFWLNIIWMAVALIAIIKMIV